MTQETGNNPINKEATLYEWCLVNYINPIDNGGDDNFMLNKITYNEFKEFLGNGNYISGCIPQKPEKYLELRMYGLVPYNLSSIHNLWIGQTF